VARNKRQYMCATRLIRINHKHLNFNFMKKILSFALTLFCFMTINAMEPLTPEQLAKLSIQINNSEDGFSLSATVGPEYTDASNPNIINI